MNHRPGAMLSAGSQTVLPTVRLSSATTVVFTTAANTFPRIDDEVAALASASMAEGRQSELDFCRLWAAFMAR